MCHLTVEADEHAVLSVSALDLVHLDVQVNGRHDPCMSEESTQGSVHGYWPQQRSTVLCVCDPNIIDLLSIE